MQVLKNKRIFMVEDSLNNKAIQTMLLERAGATIGFERWGDTTLSRLSEFMPVDLIILDLMFPKNITGFDIFQMIRNCPEFSHIPIVAVSASNASEAIPQTRHYGFDGFISKPIHFSQFPQQIARVIDGTSVWIA